MKNIAGDINLTGKPVLQKVNVIEINLYPDLLIATSYVTLPFSVSV